MKKTSMALIILLFSFYCQCLFAHDQEKVHPDITQLATEKSNLDEYLKKYLNFKNGLSTALPTDGGKIILYLLREGSKQEDHPMCRASNHFHEPLKEWNESAMSDSPWWINFYCNSWSPYYSTVTWATGFTDPASTPIPYNPYNEKSPNMWANARMLYYNALTATNQTTRENNFAQMFKALGQTMHLLQEVA